MPNLPYFNISNSNFSLYLEIIANCFELILLDIIKGLFMDFKVVRQEDFIFNIIDTIKIQKHNLQPVTWKLNCVIISLN